MTEKEKRELKDGVISIFKRFNILDHTATIGGLRDDILRYIDSLQEKPTNNDFEMALAEMIDKAQKCVVEPLVVAEQWKDELIKLAKSEEPVSEPIDFEQELYKAFGQIKDFTLGIAIAKRFYDMGRKHNEPVSDELEDASRNYANTEEYGDDVYFAIKAAFKTGAYWQIAKLMSKAIDGEVGYWNLRGLSVNVELPHSVEEGDKVKVIVIKED